MTTIEIPQKDWGQFLQEFSRRHQGWLVQIEDKLSSETDTTHTHGLPLEVVTRQLNGDEDTISIVLQQQGPPKGHLLQSISAPSTLRVEEHAEGAEKRLVIQSDGGRTTIVRLYRVILPPLLDLKRSA